MGDGKKDSPLDKLGSEFDRLQRDAEGNLQQAREDLGTLGGDSRTPETAARASRLAPNLGRFEGQVVTRWERDPDGKDRSMTLVADFAYVDPDGKRWPAPAGRRIDGASIPAAFWTDGLGAPFVGNYRRASVIHDIGCEDKAEPHKAVHRMFYWACRCDAVSQTKALLMYTAVRVGGPKWGLTPKASATRPSEQRLEAIKREIEATGDDMTIDDVEQMLDYALGE